MSWARQAVSTISGSRPSRRASSRPIWATSREWVSRLRAKSRPAVGLSTWVLAPSRRRALECSRRARSRTKSLRRELCASGSQRSSACVLYPVALATVCVPFALGQIGTLRAGQFLRIQPMFRQRRALGRPGSPAWPLGALARVGQAAVERAQKLFELRQRAHGGQAGPKVTADRVT